MMRSQMRVRVRVKVRMRVRVRVSVLATRPATHRLHHVENPSTCDGRCEHPDVSE